MKKRNIIVAIAVIIVAALLAGCHPVDPHDMEIDPSQTLCIITEAPPEEIAE